MKISVCLDSLYMRRDPGEGLEAIRACGFSAFEFWGFWNKTQEWVRQKKAELGLDCIGFCTKSFALTDPSRRDEFLAGLDESLGIARALGCSMLITQSGDDTGAPREDQHHSIAEGLAAAAPHLERAGVTLLLEPLNRFDHPTHYLRTSEEGLGIVRTVGSPRVKLLFDLYHMQIEEGDLIRTLTANIADIGHFHAAGNPGRHELDTGELDYLRILKAIASTGFDGYVGLEYFPEDDPKNGLQRFADAYRKEVATW